MTSQAKPFATISFSDICAFAADALRDCATPDDVARATAVSGSTLNVAMRMFRRYASAERYARRYTDLVGVGVISFAGERVAEFVARCERRGISAYN